MFLFGDPAMATYVETETVTPDKSRRPQDARRCHRYWSSSAGIGALAGAARPPSDGWPWTKKFRSAASMRPLLVSLARIVASSNEAPLQFTIVNNNVYAKSNSG